MKQLFITAIAGFIFGLGLSISQMINPDRVLNFLDVSGNWDPTLLFTMAGALMVTLFSFRITLKRNKPVLANNFRLPSRSDIDNKLVMGAALFGIGWGMTGYCPGPAVASLGLGSINSIIIVLSITSGFLLHKWIFKE